MTEQFVRHAALALSRNDLVNEPWERAAVARLTVPGTKHQDESPAGLYAVVHSR